MTPTRAAALVLVVASASLASAGENARTLGEHEGFATALAFSADGKRLVGVCGREAIVWDAASGKLVSRCALDVMVAASVDLSPDGKLAVVGGYGRATAYDASSGKKLWDVESDDTMFASISPDGATVALGVGRKHTYVRLHATATGKEVGDAFDETRVSAFAWAPDSGSFAIGTERAVRILDAKTRKAAKTLEHEGAVARLAWSPDGKLLAAAGASGSVVLLDPAGAAPRKLGSHGAEVRALGWARGGKIVVSVSARRVLFHDAAAGGALGEMTEAEFDMQCAAVSTERVAISHLDPWSVIRIYPLAPNGTIARRPDKLAAHAAEVNDVAWSPDGKLLVSAGDDMTVKVWDTATWTERSRLAARNGSILSLAFSRDGTRLALCGHDGEVGIWDVAESKEVMTLDALFGSDPPSVLGAAWSPDGKTLAVAGERRGFLADVETASKLGDIEEAGSVLAWAPTGKTFAMACGSRLRIREVGKKTVRTLGEKLTCEIHSITWFPDGKRIAAACYPGPLVRVFDVASGKELARLGEGGKGKGERVRITPDGKLLVAIDPMGSLQRWEATTWKPLEKIGRWGSFSCMDLSKDEALALGCPDGTIHLVDARDPR
jgi:WD40 repeat protein